MVKNWMMLGDEAFDSNHDPIGVIRISPEELKNWHKIAWKRLADVVNNIEKVRNQVFSSNFLYLGAAFSKSSGVTNEEIDNFADRLCQNINDLEYCTVDFNANSHTDDGKIILVFGMIDGERFQKLMNTRYTYIKGDMIVPIDCGESDIFS